MTQHIVQSLVFQILPSPETNDYETRILIDGADILSQLDDDGSMGLDPKDFFQQRALLEGGQALIGRCVCGVIGCGDSVTVVTIRDTMVEWSGNGGPFLFDAAAYRKWINDAANNHDWEDLNRRTARLVEEVLSGMTLEDGKLFRWASTCIAPRTVILSFECPPGSLGNINAQTLQIVHWDGVNPETAVAAAKAFRDEARASSKEQRKGSGKLNLS